MIEGGNGGRVLHLSSVRGQLGIDNGFSAYVAAKGALDALTRQQATEWAKHGITVNAISPTFVKTPQVEDLLADDAFREGLYKRIPLGRIAETDDVVGAVCCCAATRRPSSPARCSRSTEDSPRASDRGAVHPLEPARADQGRDPAADRRRRVPARSAAGGDADRAGAGRLAGAGARGAARPRAARLHRPRAVPRLLGAGVQRRASCWRRSPSARRSRRSPPGWPPSG